MSDIVKTSQPIVEKLVISEEIDASGIWTSDAFDITSVVASTGKYAIQVNITGDGECKIEYLLSIDGTTFLAPTGTSEIATALDKTTNTTGDDIYDIEPSTYFRFMKIKITETSTTDSVTVAATLIAQ